MVLSIEALVGSYSRQSRLKNTVWKTNLTTVPRERERETEREEGKEGEKMNERVRATRERERERSANVPTTTNSTLKVQILGGAHTNC